MSKGKRGCASAAFWRRLRREIKLFVRETRDGCIECLAQERAGSTCPDHDSLWEIVVKTNPRKYIPPLTRKSEHEPVYHDATAC